MLKFLFIALFHPYFVSTTHIEINVEEKVLQVSSEYFLDDFEKTLQKNNPKVKIDLEKKLPSEKELKEIISLYIADKLSIQLNQQNLQLNLLGFEIEKGKCVLYLESSLSEVAIKSCTITNIVMGDNHHQAHLIFVKNNNKEQSMKLTHEKKSHTFNF